MSKKTIPFISFLVVITTTIMAKAIPKISYNATISAPQTHYCKVQITIENNNLDSLHFSMPVWTPGSYLIREFEKSVEGVRVQLDEKSGIVHKINKNTWKVNAKKTKRIVFEYEVYAFEFSVRTSFIDFDHAFLHNTSIFMMVNELKAIPGTLTLVYPLNWKSISTALNRVNTKQSVVFEFENYDLLADSPIEIGNHSSFTFEASGVPHEVAMVGMNNADTIKFKKDLKLVCETMTKIVGEHPCKKYVFIVQHTDAGGGGLEHLNSCCVIMNRWGYTDANKYEAFLGLCAHEYFHLWNVKRIRPMELGPFDYNQENYTRMLWIAEGITSYYDELSLLRMKLVSQQKFLTTLLGYINDLENRPGARVQTLAESSFDAWIKEYRPNENSKNTTISYYAKGLVVGALLDMKINDVTQGEKGLDDVMKLLWNQYFKKENRGFTEKEFSEVVNAVAGTNLSEFLDTVVYSLKSPNYKQIFESLGIALTVTKENKKTLGITSVNENNKTIVKYIDRNSCSYLANINVNDELIALNGIRLNNDIDEVLRKLNFPKKITIIVNRGGLVFSTELELNELQKLNYTAAFPGSLKPSVKNWLRTE